MAVVTLYSIFSHAISLCLGASSFSLYDHIHLWSIISLYTYEGGQARSHLILHFRYTLRYLQTHRKTYTQISTIQKVRHSPCAQALINHPTDSQYVIQSTEVHVSIMKGGGWREKWAVMCVSNTNADGWIVCIKSTRRCCTFSKAEEYEKRNRNDPARERWRHQSRPHDKETL